MFKDYYISALFKPQTLEFETISASLSCALSLGGITTARTSPKGPTYNFFFSSYFFFSIVSSETSFFPLRSVEGFSFDPRHRRFFHLFPETAYPPWLVILASLALPFLTGSLCLAPNHVPLDCGVTFFLLVHQGTFAYQYFQDLSVIDIIVSASISSCTSVSKHFYSQSILDILSGCAPDRPRQQYM